MRLERVDGLEAPAPVADDHTAAADDGAAVKGDVPRAPSLPKMPTAYRLLSHGELPIRRCLIRVVSAGQLQLDHLRPELLVAVGIEGAYHDVLVGTRMRLEVGRGGDEPD